MRCPLVLSVSFTCLGCMCVSLRRRIFVSPPLALCLCLSHMMLIVVSDLLVIAVVLPIVLLYCRALVLCL
jgi:hypothetical protein